MTRKQKATAQLVALIGGYLVVGVLAGTWLSRNLDDMSPVMLVIGVLALIVLGGVGGGINALAKITKIQVPSAYSYLPVVQDVVVFNIVKSLKTVNALHAKLKKFNMLITSTIASLAVVLGSFAVPKLLVKIASSNETAEAAEKMLTLNTGVMTTLVTVLVIAYIIRVLYFDYVFRLVYRNKLIRLLAILPPMHLLLVAFLPNKLNSIDFESRRRRANATD